MAEYEVHPAGIIIPTAGTRFESIQGHNIIAGQQNSGGTVTNNFYGSRQHRVVINRHLG